MQKLLGYIKEYSIIALLTVMFIVPFTADAVQAINMKVEDTTISTALVTGKLLEPFSLSVQIGYRESGIDGTQFIFTQPFALGPNNTISKQLTNLKTDTDYCMFVSDAGNSAQTPIYGSELCFKTKKENDVADKEVSVLLDTQNAGFKEATINLKVTITGTGSFSLGTRYSSAGPGTYDQTLGEFFKSTQPGTFTPKIEFKNLTGNTDYYYQVYNTATNTNYFDGFFRTSAKEGQTLNSGNGVSAATPPGCIPGQYCLLAPLPGLSTIDLEDTRVADYLKIIFRIGIALAGVLAVLMLVIGGIEYMSSDVITSKESAKGRMTNAILGLILVLGAYAILNTLNPKLLEINLDLNKQTITVEEVAEDGTVLNIEYPQGTGRCPTDCVELRGAGGVDVPIKNSSGTKVEKTLKQHLQTMTTALASSAVGGNWGVTEAWQPSRTHKAECHPKGTCIDANFTSASPTAENVKIFITSAENAGLCAIYEVQNESTRSQLIQGGVRADRVKNYGGWISASHFSVYGGNCK